MKKIIMLALMFLTAPLLLTACTTASNKAANVDALTTHTSELTKTLNNPMDDSNYEAAITANAEFTDEALKSTNNRNTVNESADKIRHILITSHKEKRKLNEEKETKVIVENMEKILETTNTKKVKVIYKQSHLQQLIDSMSE